MYYMDGIMALIGPACTYALDPVARLAAYWNIPIFTGMYKLKNMVKCIRYHRIYIGYRGWDIGLNFSWMEIQI